MNTEKEELRKEYQKVSGKDISGEKLDQFYKEHLSIKRLATNAGMSVELVMMDDSTIGHRMT